MVIPEKKIAHVDHCGALLLRYQGWERSLPQTHGGGRDNLVAVMPVFDGAAALLVSRPNSSLPEKTHNGIL